MGWMTEAERARLAREHHLKTYIEPHPYLQSFLLGTVAGLLLAAALGLGLHYILAFAFLDY